jgi:hypothetical protein
MSRLNYIWFTVGPLLGVFVNLRSATEFTQSVHPSAWICEEVFIKSDIGKFHENLLVISIMISQF